MKYKFNLKNKGFTLVEILIVFAMALMISGIMMFYSTEVFASSKAAKILSDLTKLKKNVLVWYADGSNAFESVEGKFISEKSDFENLQEGSYGVVDAGKDEDGRMTWFVGYKFAAGEDEVKEKLKNKTEILGLIFSSSEPNEKSEKLENIDDADMVWMKLRERLAVNTDKGA